MDFKKRILPASPNQVLAQDGYYLWCGSVVKDDAGMYHMFASRWETAKEFRSWVTASCIVRAVADLPEGPFQIVEELSVLKSQPWSDKMVHNPTVIQYCGKYYLFYIGTTYPSSAPSIPDETGPYRVATHPARFNQRIGVAVADSPKGPWIPSENNPILRPRTDCWDSTFVTNPSVFVEDSGEIRMIYKSKREEDPKLILGLAVAQDPEGPYLREGPSPLFEYDVEDPFIWKEDGLYRMLAKDMSGELAGRFNGVLFESSDGLHWRPSDPPLAYDHSIVWADGHTEQHSFVERPQLLLEDGKPVCLYNAVGDVKSYSFNLARRIK